MSSLANCHDHSTSAPILNSDNDDENEFDSSFNRQNESMMHKVKDVVSKFLHPSFLFSTNDDTSRPKRKRSTSVEEQQTTTITTERTNNHTTTSKSKYGRSTIRDDEPQLTDDEDSNSRDTPSTEQDLTEIEQQKKRRRTANYQHILSPNGHHHNDERTSSSLISTDSIRSLSNRRTDYTSNTTPVNHNERINRLTSATKRFNILPTYRGSTSNYDPSKSPLFSAGSRKTTERTTTTTTTNLKSNEFSANYLLASSLVSRPQPSSSKSQQSPATLTHPNTSNRQMFGVNYSSINSRRLPYIERLRRRTLQDCIRLNRTVDSEPLSESVIEGHKSTTVSPALKRTKAPERECGIQCDISIVESSIEPSKKIQRTFPPDDIRNEALTVPTIEKTQSSSQTDSVIQTNSSITIENVQPSPPIIDITKPKVLGDVTPFSWPKFARAQEEYARKYPEKCRADAVAAKSVVSSTIEKPNVNIPPPVLQQTNTSTISKMPIFPVSSSRPAAAIWKCPSCTTEHPVQTAICSFCRKINPNYKRPSASEPIVTIEKEPVSSNKLPDVITKEPSVNQTVPTTTQENILPIPPAVTTSVISTTVSSFSTAPPASLSVTTKENPIITTSSITPFFGTAPILSSPTPTITQGNPVSTSGARSLIGVMPIVSSTVLTTKENPVTNNTSSLLGATTTIFDKTSTAYTTSSFQIGTPFQPFVTTPSTSLTTAVTSSTTPSIATVTPSISIPFTPFGSTPITTTAAVAASTPVVSTVSSDQPPTFVFAPNTSASSLLSSTATTSNLFSSSIMAPIPAVTTATISFPASSTTNSSTIPSNFTFTSTSTTPTPIQSAFGTGSFNLAPTSTSTVPSNPPFAFGTVSPSRPFAPGAISSINSTPAPAFGATASFGTTAPFASFGTTAPFGLNPASTDRPASSISSSLPFGTSPIPSSFAFGSTSHTIQTAAAPVFSTSGLTFAPPSSAVPIFGAGPPALSSGGSSSPFSFGASPIVSATSAPFQFSGTPPPPLPTNPFSIPVSSDSTAESANPYSISSDATSSATTSRPILRAKRRGRP